MAYVDLNDHIEIALEAEFDDTETVVNVLQYQCVGGTIADEADLLTDVEDILVALLAIIDGFAAAYTTWKRFRVRNVTQGFATLAKELTTPVTGTIAGDSMPAGVAVLTSFKTTQKRVTLRKFWGVPGEAIHNADSAWNAPTATLAGTLATFLLANHIGPSATWRYGHYHAPTAVFLLPTSMKFSTEPAYQRRRKRGAGQ